MQKKKKSLNCIAENIKLMICSADHQLLYLNTTNLNPANKLKYEQKFKASKD